MGSVAIKTIAGADAGQADLADAIFAIEPNVGVMHQVVNAQLAARRAGTHKVKTRSEVSGGGAKPYKQKGTGRARQGTTRAPHFIGGGVAHGPTPRDYSERTNKKMKRLALHSALSDRASDNKIIVVDAWSFDGPSTKGAAAALAALGVVGKSLVVLDRADETAWKSFRNLTGVHLLPSDQLNTFDVLKADYVVFTAATLPGQEA
ncbi:MAG: 50S ribosomal protein L4 [Acidimicrobiales bacterium]